MGFCVMTPLYLEGKAGMQVVLDEPALSVITAGKTRQLFPLTRISRIVVSGSIVWSMPALFACADAGINVVFLNKSGRLRCKWIGSSPQKSSVVQSFSDLLQRQDALQRYQNWSVAMQKMAVRSSARRIGCIDWRDIKVNIFDEWVKQSLNESWLPIKSRLKVYVLSTVLHYLSELGFDAQCDFLVDGAFNLAENLTEILVWDICPALLIWQQRSSHLPEQELVVKFYQQRCQRIEHLMRGLLNRLHQCLREGV